MESNQFWPIMIIDDEEENISDLQDVLESAARKAFPRIDQPVQYVTTAEEAMDNMIQAWKFSKSFSAIICDNHLQESLIHGETFLRIIQGKLAYTLTKQEKHLNLNLDRFRNFTDLVKCVKQDLSIDSYRRIEEFMAETFTDMRFYQEFVDNYFGQEALYSPKLVMFCGTPSTVDRLGLEDVSFVQKSGSLERHSELKVIDILQESGVFAPDYVQLALEEHPRFSSKTPEKKRMYSPTASRIKKKKLLRKYK